MDVKGEQFASPIPATQVSSRAGLEAALDIESPRMILCNFGLSGYGSGPAPRVAYEQKRHIPLAVGADTPREPTAADTRNHGRDAELTFRASQERSRAQVEDNRDLLWYAGLDAEHVLYASPAIESIWGVSASRLYDDGSLWWGAIDRADRRRVRSAWKACADGRSRGFDEKFGVTQPNGAIRFVSHAGSMLLDDASGNAHMSGRICDITRRTELEQDLRQSRKMDGLGRLAGGIAHDFNNLLTVIQGNSDLALDDLDPESSAFADVHEIKRAASSAAALTKQLLAFSRRQVLQPRPIQLCAVALTVENMLGRLIGDNVKLLLKIDPVSGWVLADEGQIEQVILNLTVNARDAMPDGGRITITTSTVAPHGSIGAETAPSSTGLWERLTVTDTGTGMDHATRKRIFEPFFTTKAAGCGTGLGLSTVHGIVTQSRGELHVLSKPGVGTTFSVYLPQVSEPDAPSIEAPPLRRSVSGSETILVVEDQSSLRDLVRRILEPRGYRVLAARDGDEAVRVAETSIAPIHLVISDVVMPGISARAMAARVSTKWPAVKVLFMSGYNTDDTILHDLANSKAAFLQKPFLPYDFAEKVREVLEAG